MNKNINTNQSELKQVTIKDVMTICSNCYREFNRGDKAYVDTDADYICETCVSIIKS